MEKPHRIQLSRKKGWRMPPNTVKVTRPGPYGNPFVIGERPGLGFSQYHCGEVKDAAQAVALFRRALLGVLLVNDASVDVLVKLRGKNLACWCPLDQPCHADVLLDLANRP
jgi:hypothetical protein